VPDMDYLVAERKAVQEEEEENKIGLFFKRLKDKVLPPSLTHDKSNLRIYMDKKMTGD